MKRTHPSLRIVWLALGIALSFQGVLVAQTLDSIAGADGKRITGSFAGNTGEGFLFVPKDGSAAIPVVGPVDIEIGGTGPGPITGVSPVQVILGLNQAVSGQLVSLDDNTIELSDGPGGKPFVVDRRGALGLRQRPGEAIVLIDGFESFDEKRWTKSGDPKLDPSQFLAGKHSLRLAADGSSIAHKPAEDVQQGRLELAFNDSAARATGASWYVELFFRGERGLESMRALLGWSEESLAVQTTGTISLVVQRLARKPGWHRFEVRFGSDAVEMAVDGNSLAHGKGPIGPLVEIRIGTLLTDKAPAGNLAAYIDELRLVRLASVVTAIEADPDQDEVRLLEGDQVFGNLRSADAKGVSIDVIGKPVRLPWSDVSLLQFRRISKPSRPITGLLVKLQWRAAPGSDLRDLDTAEGALISADANQFTLETPYAGTFVIPRDRARKLSVERKGTRIVIDPMAHHLGDEVARGAEALDPPQPEGGLLERVFALKKAPPAAQQASLVLDVHRVVGEANGLRFSQLIRQGELRTKVYVNDKEIDYMNHHITTDNETPERIRIPIPTGLLKAGDNRLKIMQTGKADDPNYLDDLGILGIALEFTNP